MIRNQVKTLILIKDVEDVNKALRTLRDGIEKKSEKVDLSQFVNEQSLINEFLCTENIIGRWKWKSGNVQNGALVPWEQQTINTLADNFIWEKNNPYINIMAPGLYQVSIQNDYLDIIWVIFCEAPYSANTN